MDVFGPGCAPIRYPWQSETRGIAQGLSEKIVDTELLYNRLGLFRILISADGRLKVLGASLSWIPGGEPGERNTPDAAPIRTLARTNLVPRFRGGKEASV